MARLGWVAAGLLALLVGGCAVYGSAETATVQVQGDRMHVRADRWEGSVACGPGLGERPCSAGSMREGIR
ncbi:hypothetical protein [Microvirga sp. 17 mud 1-3]|uniref:hypothetical protein n=1 Tax=Microvirga sp. 17 mud 1-3 TaxID=2082949 RepID=UPI000D6D27F6|nr:hypothetical protein [Microvirga sp. 17 mud 1-3]AWM88603.1 hypothetical protein C4E04_18955 [Microvirga sp. 17 mud 1-3]